MDALVVIASGVLGGVFAYMRQRHRANQFEQAVRDIRARVSEDMTFRALDASTPDAATMLDAIHAHEHRLEGCGLTLVGDVAMLQHDRLFAVMRAFVDAAGTSVAYVISSRARPVYAALLVESYRADAEYMTMHAAVPIAAPPFSHRQVLPESLAWDAVLARHRTFASVDDPATIRVTSMDDLLRTLAQNHELMVRWRAAQTHEELLDADLRAILGPKYDRYGKGWARRLAVRLPKATLRR